MNIIHRSVLTAALLSLVSCGEDDAYASPPSASEPTPYEAPADKRVPAPVNEETPQPKAPAQTPPEQPTPIVDPQPVNESATPPSDEPEVDTPAEPTALQLAISRGETRMETLRTRVGELRAAIDKLGEDAAQELRDGLTALGDQLARAEAKLTDLRSATEDALMQLETDLSTALDELDTAATELSKKLP